MLIYIFVFIMVSMIVKGITGTDDSVSTFSDTLVPIAVLSEENTMITEGLIQALSDVSTLVVIDDTREAIQDALFFRAVYMVVRIPEGYSDAVMNGSPLPLETTTIPGSTESVQVTLQMNQFMKLAEMYRIGTPNINEETLVNSVLEKLKNTTQVTVAQANPEAIQGDLMPFFFNYLAYSYMFIMLLGVSDRKSVV